MKKYVYSILILSLAGAFLCTILLIQHFFPESDLGFVSCGQLIDNSCIAVSRSPYAAFMGIPIASLGLFTYLVYIFTILIADYAEGAYYRRAFGVILPLILTSLFVDLILIIILILISEFCILCFLTYIVNTLLLITILLWYRDMTAIENIRFSDIYKDFFKTDDAADKRAAFSSYVLFIFFLAFSIYSTTVVLRIRADKDYTDQGKINSFLDNFNAAKEENISFPQSKLTIGNHNAPLTIRVFTDFLCSACYKFYNIEKDLLTKYKDKIRIVYYNFPLDKNCNKYLDKTIYGNSCTASKALTASAELGIFKEYHESHFKKYNKIDHKYSKKTPYELLTDILSFKKDGKKRLKFKNMINSQKVNDIVKQHIDFGESINIEATPTIFISNRRFTGVPPKEFLKAFIEKELNK